MWGIIKVMKSIIIVIVAILFLVSLPELVTLQIALKTATGIPAYMSGLMEVSEYLMGAAAILIPVVIVLSGKRNG